jgi:hypothetical protein
VWKDPTDVDFGSYGLDQCLDLVEEALAAGRGQPGLLAASSAWADTLQARGPW